ncbi:hypothetical protein [Larkinella punicea]|nr:hypothetical protein [Larkinella punicea]
MPLVFVHGVNTRKGDTYTSEVITRDALFRRYALKGIVTDPATELILNPYWGDHGAHMAFKNASLPGKKYESFGSKSDQLAQVLLEIAPDVKIEEPDQAFKEIANQASLSLAVDCLWTAVGLSNEDNLLSDEVALLADLTLQYAEENPHPSWLSLVSSNDEFVDKLLTETTLYAKPKGILTQTSKAGEQFGGAEIWDVVKESASRLASAIPKLVFGGIAKPLRPWAHERVARFVGDVFMYLKNRGTPENPGPIVRIISDDFLAAQSKRKLNNPFIIVAHSMGGNITYDILTRFHPELRPDLLITVGSQVGMFEELKLFLASDPSVPSDSQEFALKPDNVQKWINVFDPMDILGYATGKIFSETEDFVFDTGASPFGAHSMYFFRPTFHKRLQQRIHQNIQ